MLETPDPASRLLPYTKGLKFKAPHVEDYNYKPGGWAELHKYFFDDLEDKADDSGVHLIKGKKAVEAGEILRERLLQDRAATTVVTALLLTISFAMLCVDTSQIKHTIVLHYSDGKLGIDVGAIDEEYDAVDGRTSWSVGLVRAMYVGLNVISTMLSFISIYSGTLEYLLINKCPATQVIYLVDYLHANISCCGPGRNFCSIMCEPWRATVGAAATLTAAMSVLVYALYGPWIFGFAFLIIVAMAVFAQIGLSPIANSEYVFEQVHEKYHNAVSSNSSNSSTCSNSSKED